MKSFSAGKTQHAISSIRHVAKFIDFWPPLAEMKMFSQVLPDLLHRHTHTQKHTLHPLSKEREKSWERKAFSAESARELLRESRGW